jgi:hypothetical protein
MLALSILAQSAPPPISPGWQNDLFSFGLIILIALNIWDKFRRKPAIDEVLERKFKEVNEQTEKKIDALDRRREQGDKENVSLIHKEIGDIKQFISERISENRESNTERFGEMSGKIDSLTVSFQGLSNDLFHAVGKLEGEMRHTSNRPRRGSRDPHNIDE